MKIIFFTFALLAVTNAHFLRNLAATVGDATYSTKCTNFDGLKVTAALTDATAVDAAASIITLEDTKQGSAKSIKLKCGAVATTSTELVCETVSGTNELSATENGHAFKLTAFPNYTVAAQNSAVTYHADYLPLGTNTDQEIDYDDDAKTNFTVVYKNTFADGDTLPEIKVGTEVVKCSVTTTATTLTCAPDKEKIKKSEDKYQITAKDACGNYEDVAKLTVKDSSAFLKASLALLVAVFLF